MVQSIQAQKLGVFFGNNTLANYPFSESNHHYYTRFSPNIGYSMGIEFDDIKLAFIPIKLTSKIVNYKGYILHENSGVGGGYNLDLDQENYVLSLGLHLIKNKSSNPLQLSLGIEYSLLLKENFKGSTKTWSMSDGVENESIDKNSFDLNMENKFAIIGAISYELEIMPDWYIEPQFSILFGITKELQIFEPVRALKFLMEIGISKKI